MRQRSISLVWTCTFVAWCGVANAQPERFDLGLRGVLVAASGEPANDIPGAGVFAHYRLNDRWSLGFAIDRAEFDVEQPARLVGIEQDPNVEVIDALGESTIFSTWLQRNHRREGSRTSWFGGAGVGIGSVDVPDAVGPRRDGGTFHVRTEVSTEVIASLVGGLRVDLGRRWLLELALRADQHFADWQLEDSVSGAATAVDDYLALGGHLGVGFRF